MRYKCLLCLLSAVAAAAMPFQNAMAMGPENAPSVTVDPSVLLKSVNEPFSNFLQSLNNASLTSGEENPRQFFDTSNNWLKEKTGMSWTDIGKMIGGILIFVLTIVKFIIEAVLSLIKWLVSLA